MIIGLLCDFACNGLKLATILAWNENTFCRFKCVWFPVIITHCYKLNSFLSKSPAARWRKTVLRTVPYRSMDNLTPHSSETSHVITVKLYIFHNVCKTNTIIAKCSWNPPASACSTHTFYALLVAFLPVILFSYAPAQAKRIEIISRTMAQKTPFDVRNCPPYKSFSPIWRLGMILPENLHKFDHSREFPAK